MVVALVVGRGKSRIVLFLAALASVPAYVILQAARHKQDMARHWDTRKALARENAAKLNEVCAQSVEMKVFHTIRADAPAEVRVLETRASPAPPRSRCDAREAAGGCVPALAGYSTSLAKSASRERSPRASVMWPLCGQPLNLSTAKVRPDEPSVR